MANFLEMEERDGVRMSWNVWPSSRLEASRVVVPLAAMYSPLKQIDQMPSVDYEPVRCCSANCTAVLNPYCQVDYMNKIWICPFCLTRNHFPHHYADISPDNLPAELINSYTTLEYTLNQGQAVCGAPLFLFVVDTAQIEEELQQVKDSIMQSLMLLPEDSMVGLITFGKNVHIHELAFQECPKSYVLRGNSEKDPQLTGEKMASVLGMGNVPIESMDPQTREYHSRRFLLPVSECEFQLQNVLDDLTPDAWPVPTSQRPERCTGIAIQAAIGLLEACYKGYSGRIMTFLGGPCSVGPGNVVGTQLEETIRSHRDLFKGNAPHFEKALKYYQDLAKRCTDAAHVIDIFAGSLDQIGLAEMRCLVEQTGGVLVLTDSFCRGNVFIESFQKVFRTDAHTGHLQMTFNGEVEVLTGREFKVCGAIGPVSSLNKKGNSVAEKEIGVGETCAWRLGGVDPNTSVAFFFDVVNQQAGDIAQGRHGFVQFVTKYRHSAGTEHLRVSTVAVEFADSAQPAGKDLVRQGFDQEAAAVLMARLAVFKTDSEFALDILRWLDRMLIRLCAKFAQFSKDDPESFRLGQELSYYPQFMFHLRRSQFLQVFNSSPDETAFYRLILQRENVSNALTMIQPTLTAYSMDGPATPVLLDVTAMNNQRILLLDTYFHLVTWYGGNIASWRDQGIQNDPQFDYFKELLAAPEQDLQALKEDRIPVPSEHPCDEGGSQERFILAKLNPSVTHNTPQGYGDQAAPPVFTDDVSLKVFMQHLRRLAVQS